MQKQLKAEYKGRNIEIQLVGSGPSEHLKVTVNTLDITSRVDMPSTLPAKNDAALALSRVQTLIDAQLA